MNDLLKKMLAGIGVKTAADMRRLADQMPPDEPEKKPDEKDKQDDACKDQMPVPGETGVSHYGFGWRIGGERQWHSGETIGFRNVIVRWPAQRLTVILLSNRNEPEPYSTALEIGALFGGN